MRKLSHGDVKEGQLSLSNLAPTPDTPGNRAYKFQDLTSDFRDKAGARCVFRTKMQVVFTRQMEKEALEISPRRDHRKSIVGKVERESRKMRIGSIVVRCFEFEKMLAFWRQALHYIPREPAKGGWVVLHDPEGKGPNLSLDRVPEKRSGKRSRLHLDLYTNNREGEVERLIKIGATRYPWRYKPHDDFVVLEDPDGNLFCVVQVAT